MDPIYLNRLKPPELKNLAAEKPLILIPVGTTEWHADHLPLGVDSLLSQVTCREISAQTGCIIAPLLSYGIAANLTPENGYFGTVDTIRQDTLADLLVDLGEGYAKMGFKIAALISGHGESAHWSAIDSAIAKSTSIQILLLSAYHFTKDKIEELGNVEQTWPYATDHAAEWETSLMLHYYPDLVDMRAAPETIELIMPDIPEYIRVRYPRRATPEYGRQLAEATTEGGVRAITDLLKTLE